MLLNKRLANARVPYLWKIINFKIGFCWKIFSIVSAKIGLDNFCWARRNCSWFSRQLWQASQELNTYSIIWLLLLLTKVYKWWVGPTWLKSIPHSKLISLKTPKNKKKQSFPLHIFRIIVLFLSLSYKCQPFIIMTSDTIYVTHILILNFDSSFCRF